MTGSVDYQTTKEGYGVITLNRMEKHNAISENMANEFKHALQIAREEYIKFLVITGTGDKMFCAGGDLNDLHGGLSPDEALSRLDHVKGVLHSVVTFPVPTVCLLNGNALGGGCEIATACDFRVAKESTSFGFVQSKLGILPGWGGGALLYEKINPSFAYQWLMSADIYSAEFLYDKGWIHEVIPLSDWRNQQEMLKKYHSKSYKQMEYLKMQYFEKINASYLLKEMDKEVRRCADLWDSKEHVKAVEAFQNRK